MPLVDYAEAVERLQRGLGRAFSEEPWALNIPGKSVACKLDPLYYLAVMPAFVEKLSRFSGMRPENVVETLVKTGNFITRPPERDPVLSVGVTWSGKVYEIKAAFVEVDFIDRAVRMHGGMDTGLNVSDLKIAASSRSAVEEFFEDKTPPQGLAYAERS